ncbi:hypothetical protein BLOT_008753 [Blomia tropicalis]|nr:hypothetical protein BLOT_008753 [Blomia tropicalis]
MDILNPDPGENTLKWYYFIGYFRMKTFCFDLPNVKRDMNCDNDPIDPLIIHDDDDDPLICVIERCLVCQSDTKADGAQLLMRLLSTIFRDMMILKDVLQTAASFKKNKTNSSSCLQ